MVATEVSGVRYSLMLEGQEGVTWPQWLRIAEAAERLGFDALFTSDHYLSDVDVPEPGSNDAWTLLAALAARTSRLRLGTMVSPVTFRLPIVLAKAATTVDRISGGRAIVGMGAGWWEEEHRTHGVPFPPTGERFEMLEEQLEIVHGLWSQETYSFESRHYAIEGCRFLPKPLQRPHPPIVVGGKGGPRIARLVARWADEFNRVGGTPEQVGASFDRVRGEVSAAGRDTAGVRMSFMTWVMIGRTDREWRDRVEAVRRMDPSAGPFDAYLAEVSEDCIVGTVDRAVERLRTYAEAGVEHFVLNTGLFDDLEMLELLASDVLPNVAP
jgi:F420-dependent oxidoreductase-like protein